MNEQKVRELVEALQKTLKEEESPKKTLAELALERCSREPSFGLRSSEQDKLWMFREGVRYAIGKAKESLSWSNWAQEKFAEIEKEGTR